MNRNMAIFTLKRCYHSPNPQAGGRQVFHCQQLPPIYGNRSSTRKLRTHHDVVTGTHLWRGSITALKNRGGGGGESLSGSFVYCPRIFQSWFVGNLLLTAASNPFPAITYVAFRRKHLMWTQKRISRKLWVKTAFLSATGSVGILIAASWCGRTFYACDENQTGVRVCGIQWTIVS
jgi:hypothetical protein